MVATIRERTITSDACLAEGAFELCRIEPRFERALAASGPLRFTPRPDGFAALLRAVVGQQLSSAAAASIWGRLELAGITTPEALRASDDASLRQLGLSRQKVAYARNLAEAGIDFESLREQPSERVIEALQRVKGIGRWTAEIYAMFALARADVFAPGDLALQEGARLLFDLPARPREGALRRLASGWSPWRSVAAQVLWSYYRVRRGR